MKTGEVSASHQKSGTDFPSFKKMISYFSYNKCQFLNKNYSTVKVKTNEVCKYQTIYEVFSIYKQLQHINVSQGFKSSRFIILTECNFPKIKHSHKWSYVYYNYFL